MKLTAEDLLDLGVIDEVIKEPKGNAKQDVEKMSSTLKKKIIEITKDLKKIDVNELTEIRYQKFRSM